MRAVVSLLLSLLIAVLVPLTAAVGKGRDMAAASTVHASGKTEGMNPVGLQPLGMDTLGLSLRGLNDVERRVFGVPDGGLLVAGVGQGLARRAGFKTGDVILMLDGVLVSSTTQFHQLELQLPHDRPVPVLVQRPDGNLFLALSVPRPR